jgi:hypothetical protein
VFVPCASISQCNNKHHSPLHVELPLRRIAVNISKCNFSRCHGWQLQNPAFVQIETIAPLTIRSSPLPAVAGQVLSRRFFAIRCAHYLAKKHRLKTCP